MPRTRPTSSLRRGLIPKNTASRTATQIGIVYTSTDERPAGTTCSARVISTTPAAICARPTESTIGMFERSGSRSRRFQASTATTVAQAGQHAQRGVGERRHVVEPDLDDDPVQAPHERQEHQQDERGRARVDGGDRLVGGGGDGRGGLGGDPVGSRTAVCVLRRLRGGLGHPRGAGLASGLGRTMSRTVPMQVVVAGDERAQRPRRRAVALELGRRQAVRLVGAAEVRDAGAQLVEDRRVDRHVDPRHGVDAALVEPRLPARASSSSRCRRRRARSSAGDGDTRRRAGGSGSHAPGRCRTRA